jgi:hypothetical protein
MKREILFRGKTINGEWVYGDLIQIGGGALIYHGDKQELEVIPQEDSPCAVGFYPNEISPVIPKTAGQFTGLTDKNGNKIFEGDILDFGVLNVKTTIVTFEKGCFMHSTNVLYIGCDAMEVIGNIHENK